MRTKKSKKKPAELLSPSPPTLNEMNFPEGGSNTQVWCVRASPHLMPTESGPIHRMHEVINHSIIVALTLTFARCALGYHDACRGGALPEDPGAAAVSCQDRTAFVRK